MSDAVTITLPGPPVTFAVEPAAVVAHLLRRGWREQEGGSVFRLFASGPWTVAVPTAGGDMPDRMRATLYHIAEAEERPVTALAAELSKQAEGPALQWAHANADTRAPVLALLDGHARDERAAATLARMADDIESAQAHEGRAMGLEAAAAVLRASR